MDWTRRIRVQHLEVLLKLAQTGSISETARLTFTAQPALSKWLKELEDGIGAPLFARHARGLTPTEHGQMLIHHAQRVIAEMKRAHESLESISHGHAVRMTIGASPASAPNLVPAAILQFLSKYPKASIELQEDTMHHLLERLEQGELDVVIGRLDNYIPRPSLRHEVLYKEAMRVICRPGHPLTQRSDLSWNQLAEYEWIVWPKGTPIRARLDAAISAAGARPLHYRIESSSLLGNLWLLQGNDMLSVASERVTEHFSQRGLIVDSGFALDASGALGMCWRDESAPAKSLLELHECLRHAAQQRLLPPAGTPLDSL
jgi:DNA-binding transcriptional LysR family regulator